MPSESLRRRHSISDSEASPLGDESHASEHSPFSTAGEDSFFAVRLKVFSVKSAETCALPVNVTVCKV